MKLPRSVNKGFTLVELMIVVGILAIVSGIMIPSFSTYTRNQTLKQAQENLKSDLRSAQNKALTGTGSDTLINGNPVLYWAIYFTDATGSDTTYRFYLTTSGSCTAGVELQQTVNFPASISIKSTLRGAPPGVSSPGYHCLLFSLEDGSVFEQIGAVIVPIAETRIQLEHSSDTTVSKDISINKAGLIYSSN